MNKLQNPKLIDAPGSQDATSLLAMDSQERLFTTKGFGLNSLKTLKFNALFVHTLLWKATYHKRCDGIVMQEGIVTLMSPVRHDAHMMAVGIACNLCGEPFSQEDLRLGLAIQVLEEADMAGAMAQDLAESLNDTEPTAH